MKTFPFFMCLFALASCSLPSKNDMYAGLESDQNAADSLNVADTTGFRIDDIYDMGTLCRTYDELLANPENYECQRAFFDAFPSRWWDFILVYGNHGEGIKNLYSSYVAHIDALSISMTKIGDTIYCTKLIDLAIGATIEADAPSLFQKVLRMTMEKKIDVMIPLIATMNQADQMHFWQFYWSTPLKKSHMDADFKQMYNSQVGAHRKEMEIMKSAFQNFCGHAGYFGENQSHVQLKE